MTDGDVVTLRDISFLARAMPLLYLFVGYQIEIIVVVVHFCNKNGLIDCVYDRMDMC